MSIPAWHLRTLKLGSTYAIRLWKGRRMPFASYSIGYLGARLLLGHEHTVNPLTTRQRYTCVYPSDRRSSHNDHLVIDKSPKTSWLSIAREPLCVASITYWCENCTIQWKKLQMLSGPPNGSTYTGPPQHKSSRSTKHTSTTSTIVQAPCNIGSRLL